MRRRSTIAGVVAGVLCVWAMVRFLYVWLVVERGNKKSNGKLEVLLCLLPCGAVLCCVVLQDEEMRQDAGRP